MSNWSSTKAKRVLVALLSIGWQTNRQTGSHIVLKRNGWSNYIWAFRDYEEIGPRMLARIAKKTGLRPEDLQKLFTMNNHGFFMFKIWVDLKIGGGYNK